MKFKVIASSSKGNCYLLENQNGALLLEAGLPIKKIKQALNFDFSSIKGCLVTHEHKDHSKAVEDITKHGIDVYTSFGTLQATGSTGHRFRVIKDKQQFYIGDFKILAFKAEHDAAEPLGYLIQDMTTGKKLLFATDTYYIRYKFKGLDYIAIECNYSEQVLEENIKNRKLPASLAERVRRSHFSLENVIEFLEVNDISKLKTLYLLHLSEGNSDVRLFETEIRKVYQGELVIANE